MSDRSDTCPGARSPRASLTHASAQTSLCPGRGEAQPTEARGHRPEAGPPPDEARRGVGALGGRPEAAAVPGVRLLLRPRTARQREAVEGPDVLGQVRAPAIEAEGQGAASSYRASCTGEGGPGGGGPRVLEEEPPAAAPVPRSGVTGIVGSCARSSAERSTGSGSSTRGGAECRRGSGSTDVRDLPNDSPQTW